MLNLECLNLSLAFVKKLRFSIFIVPSLCWHEMTKDDGGILTVFSC